MRGLLRPFGVRLPSRVGTKTFAEAAHQATRNDAIMHAGITAPLEALVSIDAQLAKLDGELKQLAGRSEVAWRLSRVLKSGLPGFGKKLCENKQRSNLTASQSRSV